jgi:PAS domain S-box-containing protein
MNRFRAFIQALLVAFVATLLTMPVRFYVFVKCLDVHAPFFPYLIAVVAATRIGGMSAGVIATGLSSAMVTTMILMRAGLQGMPRTLQIRMLIFVAIGVLTAWLIDSFRTASRRAVHRQEQLEYEIAERRRAETAEREHRQRLAAEIDRRAAAELAVTEREERMRMAVESAQIGTWDFNPITGERNWSDRAKVMFGLPADRDVTNVSYLDRIHPDDRERAEEAVQKALNPTGTGRYEIECRLLRPDGNVGWFVVKGQVFFTGEGAARRPARFIGTVMEITERKKTEQALRRAEERFRKLATFAPVGIFHTDEIGRCLFVNDAWRAIAGASAEEALGDGWARFLHPDDQERVVREWHEAARNRINQSNEFRFVNPRTGIRWVAAAVMALTDDGGEVNGYVGTIVDLTDRKAVEDVIRADEARLRSILDNSPAVISLKDLEGRYVLVNRAWEQVYDVTNEQIVGRTNYDLLPMTRSSHMSRAIADQFARVDRQVIETGMPTEFEDPLPDGEDEKVFVTVKFPITDEHGRITGVGGITTDITERRKAVDSLLAEQDLLRRTLESVDNERQLVVYEIHDGLIQYIAGALMQVESLPKPSDPLAAESLCGVTDALRKAVAEGRRLINGIRTPVLDDLGVVAALETLIHEEDRAHVHVEFVRDEELDRMDPKIEEAIYRITQEALTNVGKHSRSKNVRVEIGRRGDRVHLEIRDWGVGFMPTHRLKGTHGLGGMTERARIVGGQCAIKSALGQGTQVVVDLPYVTRM